MGNRKKKKRLSKNLEHIFASIGYLIYLTSLVEYNLVQIISAEQYLQVFDKEDASFIDILKAKEASNETLHKLTKDNKMLGKLITLLEKTDNFTTELIENLRKVADIRGYYAHQFCKDDLKHNYLEKNPLIYKKRIASDIGFIYEINACLIAIDRENRLVVSKAKELGL